MTLIPENQNQNKDIQKVILKITKNMLKNDIPFDIIKEATGLSAWEIQRLRKEINN